jgi:hypothetical protein
MDTKIWSVPVEWGHHRDCFVRACAGISSRFSCHLMTAGMMQHENRPLALRLCVAHTLRPSPLPHPAPHLSPLPRLHPLMQRRHRAPNQHSSNAAARNGNDPLYLRRHLGLSPGLPQLRPPLLNPPRRHPRMSHRPSRRLLLLRRMSHHRWLRTGRQVSLRTAVGIARDATQRPCQPRLRLPLRLPARHLPRASLRPHPLPCLCLRLPRSRRCRLMPVRL